MDESPGGRSTTCRPPPWIKNRDRYLDRPFWPVGEGDPGLMEYLVFASPGEFKSWNVMTDEAPLSRACQPPVGPLVEPWPTAMSDVSDLRRAKNMSKDDMLRIAK